MSKAIINPAPVDPVIEVSLRIGALVRRGCELDEYRASDNEAQTRIAVAGTSLWRECEAAIDYALEMECSTLAGAAAQLLLAYNRCDQIECDIEDPETNEDIRRVSRVLRGCMKVVAAAANFDLDKVGGSYYASKWTDPRPEVNLVAVE